MRVSGLGAVRVCHARWSWCCMLLLATCCACLVLQSISGKHAMHPSALAMMRAGRVLLLATCCACLVLQGDMSAHTTHALLQVQAQAQCC